MPGAASSNSIKENTIQTGMDETHVVKGAQSPVTGLNHSQNPGSAPVRTDRDASIHTQAAGGEPSAPVSLARSPEGCPTHSAAPSPTFSLAAQSICQ